MTEFLHLEKTHSHSTSDSVIPLQRKIKRTRRWYSSRIQLVTELFCEIYSDQFGRGNESHLRLPAPCCHIRHRLNHSIGDRIPPALRHSDPWRRMASLRSTTSLERIRERLPSTMLAGRNQLRMAFLRTGRSNLCSCRLRTDSRPVQATGQRVPIGKASRIRKTLDAALPYGHPSLRRQLGL